VPDGPFPWNDEIEALINLIIAVGATIGTLLTLLVYDYLNGRVVLVYSKHSSPSLPFKKERRSPSAKLSRARNVEHEYTNLKDRQDVKGRC